MLPINLSGKRFGKLAVTGAAQAKGYWHVRCDCGNEKDVRAGSLTSGNTKSCGCLVKKNPGRPKRVATDNIIPLTEFVDAVFPHIDPMRNFLKSKGVLVRSDGTYYVNGIKFGPFHHPIEALARAIIRTVAK